MVEISSCLTTNSKMSGFDEGIGDEFSLHFNLVDMRKKSSTSPLHDSAKSSSIESTRLSCDKSHNIDQKCSSLTKRSSTSSPLLFESQPIPIEHISICPYCNKNFRKV